MTRTILRVDASARQTNSVSRELTDRIIARSGATSVTVRDLADGLPLIDEAWVGANFTPADDRTDDQRATLALSDTLVEELKAADTIVIGLPIYNFGVPAALKAWIDLIARAGLTFRYTENGPVGLLEGKKAVIAIASGGTEAGSSIDFATGYVQHILGFLGITDVEVVAADRLMLDPGNAIAKANAQVDALHLAA
ncbi:MAG: NAD(P)H-dependent oxidoreductase [Pseudomonadota bacterium]